jgi:hypothetical protein
MLMAARLTRKWPSESRTESARSPGEHRCDLPQQPHQRPVIHHQPMFVTTFVTNFGQRSRHQMIHLHQLPHRRLKQPHQPQRPLAGNTSLRPPPGQRGHPAISCWVIPPTRQSSHPPPIRLGLRRKLQRHRPPGTLVPAPREHPQRSAQSLLPQTTRSASRSSLGSTGLARVTLRRRPLSRPARPPAPRTGSRRQSFPRSQHGPPPSPHPPAGPHRPPPAPPRSRSRPRSSDSSTPAPQ